MIIDASVALKWLIAEEGSAEAIDLIGQPDLRAPTLIHAEVGNAIWKKRRCGELADDPGLAELPAQLASLLATVDETPMLARALELALEVDHPIYDCIYLAVAEALDCEMITADLRFVRKIAKLPAGERVRRLT